MILSQHLQASHSTYKQTQPSGSAKITPWKGVSPIPLSARRPVAFAKGRSIKPQAMQSQPSRVKNWLTNTLSLSCFSQAQVLYDQTISNAQEQYGLLFQQLYADKLQRKCPPAPKWENLPPLEVRLHTDPGKLEIAQDLSNWAEEKMNTSGAQVAVIARGGSHISKTKDKTWMEHSGILVYQPREKQWQVYNLMNDFCDQRPTCYILRHSLLDFFYTQPNYDKDALLMVPPKEIQEKMLSAMQSGEYRRLQFTDTYNLVTPFSGKRSLNCNKWTLMNIVAAKTGNYEPVAVLDEIDKNFKPGRVRVCPLIRPIAKQHPTILQSEAPLTGPINTVTAESLYRSDLFEEKTFRSGKVV